MALNTRLLPRPWSCHAPRVQGYEPLIKHRIQQVAKGGRNKWRCEILVDGTGVCFSHHPTKARAESKAESMLEAYTEAHYINK